MSESASSNDLSAVPEARQVERSRRSLSLIWFVPLIAVAIGGWLAWKAYSETGPLIVVTFGTGDGIEPGKTKIRFKSVELGIVEAMELAPEESKVLVKIRMQKSASDRLVEDTQFWVVRPRISGTNIEGLGTLLSGAYIGMDVGKSKTRRSAYEGLERPPIVTIDRPGRFFRLKAEELGSLDTGSPVYYRRLQVGQLVSYEMSKDGKGLEMRLFVNAPYDRFVTSQTRFWEASGVAVELSASGARLETQSLNSILAGGIVFHTRGEDGEPVKDDAQFTLFKRREIALAFEDLEVFALRLRFDQSARGLAAGAPVDFRGITVGEVKRVGAELDAKNKQVHMIADIEIYPERFRRMRTGKDLKVYTAKQMLDLLAAGGVRGQLRTGSLLSGQLYVAVDFFKDAPRAAVLWDQTPPQFPTMPGTFSELEDSITLVARKLSRIPFEELAADTRRTLKTLDTALEEATGLARKLSNETVKDVGTTLSDLRKVLATADGALAKADSALGKADQVLAEDSPLQTDVRDSLREVARAAASLRALLDYLEQRPEALLRGKSE